MLRIRGTVVNIAVEIVKTVDVQGASTVTLNYCESETPLLVPKSAGATEVVSVMCHTPISAVSVVMIANVQAVLSNTMN